MEKKTKKCSKCGEEKPLSEFCKNRNSKDGYATRCRLCGRMYYLRNKESILKKTSQYKKEHKEILLAKQREYAANHREERNKYLAKYRNKNRQKLRELHALWRHANNDRLKIQYYQYYLAHKIQHRESDREYRRKLPDSYIVKRLKEQGFTDITPDLIELKRAELTLKRAIKTKKDESNKGHSRLERELA